MPNVPKPVVEEAKKEINSRIESWKEQLKRHFGR